METKGKIPMHITQKQFNKSNTAKTDLMQIKRQKIISNLKIIKMLFCLYDVIEGLMNINEAV